MKKLSMDELGRLSAEENQKAPKKPIVVVLDSIRSLHNVGSIFRTCDAMGVEALYLCGITGCPPNREIEKTALGATDSVKWIHKPNIEECLQELREEGYKILAIEQTDQSEFLHQVKVDPECKYALVFGNEVQGVSDAALSLCHSSVEIPQFGSKHSFNVSVTAGIVLWVFAVGVERF